MFSEVIKFVIVAELVVVLLLQAAGGLQCDREVFRGKVGRAASQIQMPLKY